MGKNGTPHCPTMFEERELSKNLARNIIWPLNESRSATLDKL
jgi:hypothetical protein